MDRLSDAAVEQFIAVRRDIHRHPELAFSERRTAALVAAQLGAWGYAVTTGLGGTGVGRVAPDAARPIPSPMRVLPTGCRNG